MHASSAFPKTSETLALNVVIHHTQGGRRLGIRGQAFGVGAFEDDDEDIYAKDDMTQYAFEEVEHSRGQQGRTPKHPMIGR